MSTKQEIDAKLRLQQELHTVWLKHPQTQAFISIIEGRVASHTKELQDGILVASDEKKENKYRSSLLALKAILSIVKDQGIFIVEHNKLTPNE